MRNNLKWACCLLCNGILILSMELINGSLAPFLISINLGVLLFAFPALTFSFFSGLLCTSITGLAIDASSLYQPGTHLIYYSIGFTALYWIKEQFPTLIEAHKLAVLQTTNALLILTLSFHNGSDLRTSFTFWINVTISLAISQLMMLAVAPWFFSLQYSLSPREQKEELNQ